jgi:hypothetical protein
MARGHYYGAVCGWSVLVRFRKSNPTSQADILKSAKNVGSTINGRPLQAISGRGRFLSEFRRRRCLSRRPFPSATKTEHNEKFFPVDRCIPLAEQKWSKIVELDKAK